MERPLTRNDIREWVDASTGDWFLLDDLRRSLNIGIESDGLLRKALHDLCDQGICEALGGRSGRYRKIDKTFKPVPFWKLPGSGDFPIVHPYGVDDQTCFGFEEKFTFKRGSSYVVGGVSNAGKTTYVNNLLFANMDRYHIKYFCTESNRYKFWGRIQAMDWASPFKKEPPESVDDCKFEFIPMESNFADMMEGADIYIVDWINLTDEIWKVGSVIQKMVNKVDRQGEGLVVVCLQKDPNAKNPRGNTWALDFADFAVTLDKNRLTVVKSKLNGSLEQKMWWFDIMGGGSRFANICKIARCPKCNGTGKVYQKDCLNCIGKGYVEVENRPTTTGPETQPW